MFRIVLVLLILSVLALYQFNACLRPVVAAVAESSLEQKVNQRINNVFLNEETPDYSEFVTIQYDASGRICALSANMGCMNQFRAKITNQVLTKMADLEQEVIGVPMGCLTGITMFSALGPKIPVEVMGVSSVYTTFTSSFSQAGINQTLHQIQLTISVPITLLLPGWMETNDYTQTVTVAETVLMGEVPEQYADGSAIMEMS